MSFGASHTNENVLLVTFMVRIFSGFVHFTVKGNSKININDLLTFHHMKIICQKTTVPSLQQTQQLNGDKVAYYTSACGLWLSINT